MNQQSPFKWYHCEAEIILLGVRWYLRYLLSYRDLEEMMQERGLALAYLVKEITESPSPIVFSPLPQDDPKQRRSDISRAKELLHWESKVPVRDELMRIVDYCRDALRRPSTRGGV